jgi:hypothetical protein
MWLKAGAGVTNVAEGSDSQLWTVGNTAVNLQLSQNAAVSRLTEQLLASERLCHMELHGVG